MTTLSFSVDSKTKEVIETFAKAERKTRSDVLRDMTTSYALLKRWEVLQKVAQNKARKNNLQSEEDIEAFLG